ncbi:ABC transporter permease [Peptoniphilus catoniae]|uniref:ABC transporter permease n=1 Tax=Peptoniphilus catoniae TaxID=1660341 RepID=UPI0010FCEE43|nr:ABC transporter permease [Peptoniphilus catoniae]
MDIIIGIFEQGMTYVFLALGLYIAYIILDFPDLTVDGSFPLGAAVSVFLIVRGVDPLAVLFISFFAGAMAGMITGLIHIKLGVKDLLSGLIMQTALYTINLFVAGKANVPIFNNDTIFSNKFINGIIPESLVKYKVLIIMIPIVLILKFALDAFLKTKAGFLLRATGDNPVLVRTMAKDPGMIKIQGLAISNGLVALSGALVAQEQKFFEISMGTGSMVMGLASVVLGMKLLERVTYLRGTSKVVIGSILYKASIALAISIGLTANSMKLITALIFLAILVLGDGGLRRKRVKNA